MENNEEMEFTQEFELDKVEFKGFEYYEVGSDEPEELDFNYRR